MSELSRIAEAWSGARPGGREGAVATVIEGALRVEPLYIGLLGSRGRSARLVDELKHRTPELDLTMLHAPRALFDELGRIEGDRGARDLIRSLDDVELVELRDTRDVDDRDSYAQVMRDSGSTE